jgi:hypothetical protein
MKIIIKEQQSELLGELITKLIMKRFGDVLCDIKFDPEPDDENIFWVNLYFKENWYDVQPNGVRFIRSKSFEIRDFVKDVTGITIRVGISLKDC